MCMLSMGRRLNTFLQFRAEIRQSLLLHFSILSQYFIYIDRVRLKLNNVSSKIIFTLRKVTHRNLQLWYSHLHWYSVHCLLVQSGNQLWIRYPLQCHHTTPMTGWIQILNPGFIASIWSSFQRAVLSLLAYVFKQHFWSAQRGFILRFELI